MKPSTKSVVRGCSLVLGTVALVCLLAVGSMIWSTFRGYDRALDSRRLLEERFDTQDTFTPYPEDRIPEDRIKAFLEVRKSLFPLCKTVTDHQGAFQRIEDFEKSPPSAKEALGAARDILKRMMRIGPDFGEFINRRNDALIEQQLGLGEYTWLYVVSYFSLMGERPISLIPSSTKPRAWYDRAFPQIRSMVERHLEELEEHMQSAPGPGRLKLSERIDFWKKELDLLSFEPDRIPLQDGLPEEVAKSLLPYREQLQALSCPAAADLNVVLTEKTTMGYDHR